MREGAEEMGTRKVRMGRICADGYARLRLG